MFIQTLTACTASVAVHCVCNSVATPTQVVAQQSRGRLGKRSLEVSRVWKVVPEAGHVFAGLQELRVQLQRRQEEPVLQQSAGHLLPVSGALPTGAAARCCPRTAAGHRLTVVTWQSRGVQSWRNKSRANAFDVTKEGVARVGWQVAQAWLPPAVHLVRRGGSLPSHSTEMSWPPRTMPSSSRPHSLPNSEIYRPFRFRFQLTTLFYSNYLTQHHISGVYVLPSDISSLSNTALYCRTLLPPL